MQKYIIKQMANHENKKDNCCYLAQSKKVHTDLNYEHEYKLHATGKPNWNSKARNIYPMIDENLNTTHALRKNHTYKMK